MPTDASPGPAASPTVAMTTIKIDPLQIVGLQALERWARDAESDGCVAAIAAATGASATADESLCLLLVAVCTLAGQSERKSDVMNACIGVLRQWRDNDLEAERGLTIEVPASPGPGADWERRVIHAIDDGERR